MAGRPRRRRFCCGGTASASRSAAIVLTAVLMLMLPPLAEVSAKRGCSAFGHSCYGGHGKRSSYSESSDPLLEMSEQRPGKDDVGPSSDYDLQQLTGRQPNPESAAMALLRAAELARQRSSAVAGGVGPPLARDLPSSNSWSVLVRKLLLPLRRPYLPYSDVQK